MNRVIWVILFCLTASTSYSQFYLRGEIKDERGRLLEGVRITLSSKGTFPYYSGNGGTFGISESVTADTITLTLDGYETLRAFVDTRKFQNFFLKMLPTTAHLYNKKLSSFTTNLKAASAGAFSVMGESYSNLVENNFIDADKYPETGFALNVDKASYSNIRRFLNNEMLVPTDAVRIEEMLNYFDFTKPGDALVRSAFTCRTQLTSCPWRPENQLLFLNVSAPKLDLEKIPPSNLVFLIDISGSMDKPNRLPLLQSAFKLLADNLREKDTITIVTYGGGVGIALQPTGGADKKKIKDVIDSLVASGDTPGAGAVRIAYDMAKKTFIKEGNNRVILATDGDFNIGQTSEKELEDMITGFKQTGIYLTCLGVGMGNYKDSKLETLAKKGNGNFAYIDNLQEAQKILVKEFTQTIYAVANNAYLKVVFKPGMIEEYRLIGFDNKKNAASDSTSELEGGEVGSGHSMMAIFEIKPVAKDSFLYHRPLAAISIQYRMPITDSACKQNFQVLYEPQKISEADSGYRFAAAIAMFGAVLRQSKFLNDKKPDDVLNFALTAADPNNARQAEFLSLIEKAFKIYRPVKKKKKTQ
jgi:Ca-activated chloride channel family protein